MQNKAFWIGLGVIGAILVAGVIFLGRGTMKAPEVAQNQAVVTPTPTPTATTEPTDQEEGVREITIEGDEYSFSPANISFKKGERVRLIFKNVGKFAHNLTIDELEVETKTVSGGSEDVIEFVADKEMKVEFYCSVGSHRAQGMEGSLTVE